MAYLVLSGLGPALLLQQAVVEGGVVQAMAEGEQRCRRHVQPWAYGGVFGFEGLTCASAKRATALMSAAAAVRKKTWRRVRNMSSSISESIVSKAVQSIGDTQRPSSRAGVAGHMERSCRAELTSCLQPVYGRPNSTSRIFGSPCSEVTTTITASLYTSPSMLTYMPSRGH